MFVMFFVLCIIEIKLVKMICINFMNFYLSLQLLVLVVLLMYPQGRQIRYVWSKLSLAIIHSLKSTDIHLISNSCC